MPKPNLIICCLTTAPGGIDEVICQLLNSLDYSLFDQTVLLSFEGNKLFRNLEGDKPFTHKKFELGIGKINFLKTLFRIEIEIIGLFREKPLVIYNPHEIFAFYLGFVASLTAPIIPLIVPTVHQVTYTRPVSIYKKSIYKMLDILAYKRSDGLIAIAEVRKKQLIKECGVDEKKIKVVLNGIKIRELTPTSDQKIQGRKSFSIDDDTKLVIGYSGRLSKEKGPDRLVESIATMNKEFLKKLVVLIAGSGPLEDELSFQIKALGISNSVKLVGFQENTDNFYTAIDVLVQPSREEGLSLSVLEAMSYGIPVVASYAGGNPEVVINNYNGWLFENEDELTEIIFKILINRSNISEMRRNCLLTIQNKFNQDDMVRKTESFLLSFTPTK